LKTYFTVFKPMSCIFFYKHKNISSVHDKSLYCIVLQFSVAFLMSFILCFDLKYESAVFFFYMGMYRVKYGPRVTMEDAAAER